MQMQVHGQSVILNRKNNICSYFIKDYIKAQCMVHKMRHNHFTKHHYSWNIEWFHANEVLSLDTFFK